MNHCTPCIREPLSHLTTGVGRPVSAAAPVAGAETQAALGMYGVTKTRTGRLWAVLVLWSAPAGDPADRIRHPSAAAAAAAAAEGAVQKLRGARPI